MIRDVINDAIKATEGTREVTRGIVSEALTKMGCVPTITEDGSMLVTYKHGTFYVAFRGHEAVIVYTAWSSADGRSDIYTSVLEAINRVNFDYDVKVIADMPNEEGMVALHSFDHLPLFPGNPENFDMIKGVFDQCIQSEQSFKQYFWALTRESN